MKVEKMIYFYLAICVAMIVFNIVYMLSVHRRSRRFRFKSDKLSIKIGQQLVRIKNGEDIEPEHIAYLYKKLKRTANLVAVDDCLESFYIYETGILVKYLSSIMGVFISLTDEYLQKDPIKVAYFPFIVKKYRLLQLDNSEKLKETMLKLVNTSSMYARENALQAIFSSGDESLVLKAFLVLDKSPYFHHEQLLKNGLLKFEGNVELLSSKFDEAFDEFSDEFKVIIIEYFRYGGIECSEKLLKLLADKNTSDEVNFAIIKYFRYYKNDKAYPILINFMKDKKIRWEYKALCATALSKYESDESIRVLKKALRNPNWYVRYNAAETLAGYRLDYRQYQDILEGPDKAAGEMLRFKLELKQ